MNAHNVASDQALACSQGCVLKGNFGAKIRLFFTNFPILVALSYKLTSNSAIEVDSKCN